MKEYILSYGEIEQIENWIRRSASIDNLYQKLYNLEVNNQKDTEEYNKLLEYLNIATELERKNYDKYELNFTKSLAWSTYLLKVKLPKDFVVDDIESLIIQNYDNRVIRRILNILSSKMREDYENVKNFLPKEFEESLLNKGLNNVESSQILSKSIYAYNKIQKSLEHDVFSSYLLFLKEFTQDNQYQVFKDKLISAKYNVAFVNSEIEDDMLRSNFDISDILYFNSKFVSDFLEIESFTYELTKDQYGTKISKKQITKLVDISDMDYNDTNKTLESILRQCFIRSSFLLMSEDALEESNYHFHALVESEDYINKHSNDKISEYLVINCFNKIKNDKEKPRVLSLGYKPN